ncbi:cell wall-binding repeat-containing protein [Desulfitobacterium sp. Sab5]|uniref:cell wall-binding repeat-containing protein n=1 Tax=Desulfitobacterium nosdiversum TaxID=3375356 RepID=UPI003CF31303
MKKNMVYKYLALFLAVSISLTPLLFLNPLGASASTLSTSRIGGTDRIKTAIQIADNGWSSNSNAVVLVRDDDFPDALAGTPLAHIFNAPILLTNKNILSPDTETELTKLHPKIIFILGSYGAVSEQIETTLKSNYTQDVRRIGGSDRYDTAAKIAEYMHQQSGSSYTDAVIAYGENFPDALAISSFAGHDQVPILLTQTHSIPEVTKSTLNDLGVTNTVIVGGSGVIDDNVLSQLPHGVRIAGNSRYETASAIASVFQPTPKNLYIATGEAFPDALAGAALAAKNGDPILLVDPQFSSSVVINYLQEYRNSIQNVIVLGGTGVISQSIADKISGIIQNGFVYAPTITTPTVQAINPYVGGAPHSPLTIKWTSVPGASLYSLMIIDMNTGSIVAFVNRIENWGAFSPEVAGTEGHRYKIKVGANVNGNLYWGTSYNLNVIDMSKKLPTLVSPAAGDITNITQGNDVTVTWDPADPNFTTPYKVILQDQLSGQILYSQYVDGTATTIPGSLLKANETSSHDYVITVCITNGSDKSDPNYFETDATWVNKNRTFLHVMN